MWELSHEQGQNASVFFERLAARPYCMEGKEEGMLILPKAKACLMPLIQYNTPRTVFALCFDIDRELAHEAAYEANIPQPSLIVTNMKNGHAHLYYNLKTPVHRLDCKSFRPVRYLAAIQYGMREALQADAGHSGLIGKTPYHPAWRTREPYSPALYELGELAEYVNLPTKIPRLGIREGIGRNVEIFDRLRFWAYKWVGEYKQRTQWENAVLSRAPYYNVFPVPLGPREVDGIAKSVARWVWQRYTGRISDAEFSAIQSKRRSNRLSKVNQATIEAENGRIETS